MRFAAPAKRLSTSRYAQRYSMSLMLYSKLNSAATEAAVSRRQDLSRRHANLGEATLTSDSFTTAQQGCESSLKDL